MPVKYGTYAERISWAKDRRAKWESLSERVILLDTLGESELIINRDTGYAMYRTHSVDCKKLIGKAHDLISASTMAFTKKSKPFVKLDFFTTQDLTLDSPFTQLALNRDIVTAASKYLGHVPMLHSCGLWYSRHTRDKWAASQLFHCDWEDIECVTVLVHISNIMKSDGPFTFIPADKSQAMRDKLKYTYSPDDYNLDDDTVDSLCSQDDMVVSVGPPSTILLVDSCRCFHQGSRVRGPTPRIVAVMKYLSPAAFNIDRSHSPFAHMINDKLDRVSKLVLGDLQ